MRSCAGRFVCAFRCVRSPILRPPLQLGFVCCCHCSTNCTRRPFRRRRKMRRATACSRCGESHSRARAHLRLAPRTGRSLGIVQCSCLRRHSSVAMHKLVRVAHVRCTCVRARAPAALANKQPNGPKFGGRSTRARPKSRVGRTRKAGSKR